jgi:hypothetical protein
MRQSVATNSNIGSNNPYKITRKVLDTSWNWFFYWKISPSVWEAKIKEYPKHGPILFPLYWAMHGHVEDRGIHYDFGQFRGDCDLKTLEDLALKHDLTPFFVLPIGPCPFLKNGGIPDWITSPKSELSNGMPKSFLDAEGKLQTLKSFYAPQAFKHYKNFVAALGRNFVAQGFSSRIKGAIWGAIEDKKFVSAIDDDSFLFQSSFERFLDRNKTLANNEYGKEQFKGMLNDLLLEMANDCLHSYWDGHLKVSLLGGGSRDWLERSYVGEGSLENKHWDNIFECLASETLPSPILIEKKGLSNSLRTALGELIDFNYFKNVMGLQGLEDHNKSFQPLVVAKIYGDEQKHLGIDSYLNDHCPYNYRFSSVKDLDEEIMNDEFMIQLFSNSTIDRHLMKKILKQLISGKKIILDLSKVDGEARKTFEVFLLENDVRGQIIRDKGELGFFPFGEGKLVSFESSSVEKLSVIEKKEFWNKIFKFLDCHHLKVKNDAEIKYYILRRATTSFELNYDEIRRVFFCNPCLEPKSVFIPQAKGFVFLKYLENAGVELKSSPTGVSLKMQGQTSISLDFGFIENAGDRR